MAFEVASAGDAGNGTFDPVTAFDALHDMGDPAGAARQVLDLLDADGSRIIVEPMAEDRVEDNFNPVGRAYTVSQRCCARRP